MQCKNCGHHLNPGDVFCGECGAKVEEHVTNQASQPEEVHHFTTTSDGQVHHTTETSSTQVPPQTGHTQPQQTQIVINKEQVSAQSKELVNEGKGFFRSAYLSHDRVLDDTHSFSPLLNAALIGIGLILFALLFSAVIPDELSYIGVSKSSVVFKLVLGILIFIAVLIGATYGIARLTSRGALKFTKVLSDYVLINTLSFTLIIVSVLLSIMGSLSFGGTLMTLAFLLLIMSPVFLLAKYTSKGDTRFPSFYSVIIYIIVLFIGLSLFYSIALEGPIRSAFSQYMNIFGGLGL